MKKGNFLTTSSKKVLKHDDNMRLMNDEFEIICKEEVIGFFRYYSRFYQEQL